MFKKKACNYFFPTFVADVKYHRPVSFVEAILVGTEIFDKALIYLFQYDFFSVCVFLLIIDCIECTHLKMALPFLNSTLEKLIICLVFTLKAYG